jgi:hypothetical protein
LSGEGGEQSLSGSHSNPPRAERSVLADKGGVNATTTNLILLLLIVYELRR